MGIGGGGGSVSSRWVGGEEGGFRKLQEVGGLLGYTPDSRRRQNFMGRGGITPQCICAPPPSCKDLRWDAPPPLKTKLFSANKNTILGYSFLSPHTISLHLPPPPV